MHTVPQETDLCVDVLSVDDLLDNRSFKNARQPRNVYTVLVSAQNPSTLYTVPGIFFSQLFKTCLMNLFSIFD